MRDGGKLAKSWCGKLDEVGNVNKFAMMDLHILRKEDLDYSHTSTTDDLDN